MVKVREPSDEDIQIGEILNGEIINVLRSDQWTFGYLSANRRKGFESDSRLKLTLINVIERYFRLGTVLGKSDIARLLFDDFDDKSKQYLKDKRWKQINDYLKKLNDAGILRIEEKLVWPTNEYAAWMRAQFVSSTGSHDSNTLVNERRLDEG